MTVDERTLVVDYEGLDEILRNLGEMHDQAVGMRELLQRHTDNLESGLWQGSGARAYYAEFDDLIRPALDRLVVATEQAQYTIQQMQAETLTLEERILLLWLEMIGLVPGADGTASGGDSGGAAGAAADKPTSFWDRFDFKAKNNIWGYDRKEGGKFDPGLGVQYGVSGAVWGDPSEDGFSGIYGEAGAGAGYGKDGFVLGAYGDYYTAQGKIDGVAGDSDLGLTGGAGVKALSANGFIGVKDKTFGASIGGNLVSAQGSVGTNVAGANVSVEGEIGLKAEFGFQIGKRTKLKLPLISIGFSFGEAKE